MSKTPPELPELSTPADDDLLIIEDVSAGATKKITRHNFLKGSVVQEVLVPFNDINTGTTVIPKDNTIPQSGEGTEFMTADFTPRFADSQLIIEVVVFASLSTTDDLIAALYKDSDADALAADSEDGNADTPRNIKLGHTEAATTATERTYKVRVGGSAASTVSFNGASAARLFGAITKSYIKITEVAG